jgi:hypothetical protein
VANTTVEYIPSLEQQRVLLSLERAGAYGAALHPVMPIAFRLRGKVDRRALRWAVEHIVARHDALRSSFYPRGRYEPPQRTAYVTVFARNGLIVPGLWSQAIRMTVCPSLEFVELDNDAELEVALQHAAEKESNAMSDLTRGELVRFLLVSVSDVEHVFVVALSHLIADGWSVGVLMRQLIELYEIGLTDGETDAVQTDAATCLAASLERRALSEGRLDRSMAFWKGQWNEAADALLRVSNMPFARGAVAHAPIKRMAWQRRAVDDAASIRRLSARFTTTPFVLFRAAVTLAMHVLCKRTRIATWTNFANRTAPELRDVVDWCSRAHIIVSDVRRCATFYDLCQQLSASIERATPHESLSLEVLWQMLGMNLNRSDTHVTIDFRRATSYRSPSWTLTPLVIKTGRQWMDLDIRLRDCGDSFCLDATSCQTRYDQSAIAVILEATRHVVCAAVADPSIALERCIRLVRDVSERAAETRGAS